MSEGSIRSIIEHKYFAPIVFVLAIGLSVLGGFAASETWQYSDPQQPAHVIDFLQNEVKQKRVASLTVALTPESLNQIKASAETGTIPRLDELKLPEDASSVDGSVTLTAGHHYGFWSILPAILTLVVCLLFREPLPALLTGIISAALVLARYNLTDEVLIQGLATTGAAGILLLYLWLLGALLGVWAKTGAALAFAEWTCQRFVRGPKSAKLVAWFLGLLFFQGGTISTVLVGTTVRPITDRNRISPEELSYIVDSTASPIASLIPLNAWPGYVAGLIFVPGIAYLATEADRIGFFFRCAPLSFYSIFAILGTLLLSLDRAPLLGKRFRSAIESARGAKDVTVAPTDEQKRIQAETRAEIADGYTARPWEFAFPLFVLIAIAISTGLIGESGPQVRWAFAAALALSGMIALFRGMSVNDLATGVGDGLKGVTVVSVILLMAVVLGTLTKELGGGLFVTNVIGGNIPLILMPAMLFVLTGATAFATGTSFGTYAIAFPLTMPLSISLAAGLDPNASMWFVMLCFAAVINGSVFGDQCSPISDTTILSAHVSGCDLMDHVRTQLRPALIAGGLAMIAWTGFAAWALK